MVGNSIRNQMVFECGKNKDFKGFKVPEPLGPSLVGGFYVARHSLDDPVTQQFTPLVTVLRF
jgi:hypothetical protein